MCHTAFLHNKLVSNIKKQCPNKNYELIIPIQKIFGKANMYPIDVEYEIGRQYVLSDNFEKAFQKAFYHYKYLTKHFLTWGFRIPFPKFKFIKNEKLNLLIRVLFFIISTIAVYLLETYLDTSGLGTQILNHLSGFLNSLI